MGFEKLKLPFSGEFLVGAGGFEPPTSRTRTVRSIRAEPRPADIKLYHSHSFLQDRDGTEIRVAAHIYLVWEIL